MQSDLFDDLLSQVALLRGSVQTGEYQHEAIYVFGQIIFHYTEVGQYGHLPQPLNTLREVKDGEVAGIRIINPNARVFVGEGCAFSKVTISGNNAAFIYIGRDSVVEKTDIACHSKLSVFISGYSCRIDGLFVHTYGSTAFVCLGPGVTSQSGCNFCVQENKIILIGSDTMLSTQVFIRTSDSHGIYSLSDNGRVNWPKSVIIHPHVWVGRSVNINKGTEVATNVVIGQGAVVHGNLKGSSIYSGAPASLVRENVFWDRRTAPQLSDDHIAEAHHFLSSFQVNSRQTETSHAQEQAEEPLFATLSNILSRISLSNNVTPDGLYNLVSVPNDIMLALQIVRDHRRRHAEINDRSIAE